MYLKPRKYQVGGIAYTPYLPAQAGTAQESTSSSSSSSSSSSDKISGTFTKEIVDILKENGIPSDVDTFLNYANTSLNKMRSLSLTGESDDYDISDVIKIQQLANKVKFNKGLYDNATDNLTKEMAWSEVAIDNRGYMYAYGEDGLTKVSASEYYKDPEKYSLLTNSDLLSYRENQGAFNSDILNNVKNAVGMQSITNYLRDTIKNFGKSSIEGYATKDRDAILNGFHNLMTNGPEGYYKAKAENQVNDTTKAISYLYNTLPNNMKQLLRAKTAAEGGNPNSNDIFELLVQALTEHTSYTYSVDFDKNATDYDPLESGKKGGSSSSSEQLTQNNYLQQIGNKRLYKTNAAIVPMAAQVWETGTMVMPVYNAGAPIDKNGDVLGKMSLSEFRKQAEATKAGDMSSVTFGNRVLKGNEMDMIMYDGSSEINIVMLPYKKDSQTGQTIPDFSMLIKFNEIQKFIKEHPGASEMEIAEKAKEQQIDWNSLNYDYNTNSITIKDTMPFITFSAYAGSDSFKIDKNMKPFLEHVDGRTAKPMLDAYNNVINYGIAEPKKSDRKINDFNTPERRDFYKGNVYIPMENSARAMLLSGIGEYVPKNQMTDFAARVMAREDEVAQIRMLQEQDPNYRAISQNLGKF